MMLEDMIRSAVDRIRTVGYRQTHYAIRDGVIAQDADGDGKLDHNPDTGSGQERGSIEITILRDSGDFVCEMTEADFAGCETEQDCYSRMMRAIGAATGA